MNKREKNLIIASIAAVVFALVYLPGRYSTRKTFKTKAASDVNKFVASVINKVNTDHSEGLNEYIVNKVMMKWKNDPFLQSDFSGDISARQITYNGYVKSGNTILAVINGLEYGIGEIIEDKKAVIKNIRPERVVIVDAKKRKIILPLEGEMK